MIGAGQQDEGPGHGKRRGDDRGASVLEHRRRAYQTRGAARYGMRATDVCRTDREARAPHPFERRAHDGPIALWMSRSLARQVACAVGNRPAIGRRLAYAGRLNQGEWPIRFGQLPIARGQRVLHEAGALHDELKAVADMDAGQWRIVAGLYAFEDPTAEAVARLNKERTKLRIRITQVGFYEVSPAGFSRDHELGIGGRERRFPHEHLVSSR